MPKVTKIQPEDLEKVCPIVYASAVLTTLQYLSVMMLFAYIGYMVQMLLKRNKKTADS